MELTPLQAARQARHAAQFMGRLCDNTALTTQDAKRLLGKITAGLDAAIGEMEADQDQPALELTDLGRATVRGLHLVQGGRGDPPRPEPGPAA